MVPNAKKMMILESVAKGSTFKRAAELAAVPPTSARQAFSRICRVLGIPAEAEYVRANAKDVLRKLKRLADIPANKLSSSLRHSLIKALNVSGPEALTPELVSKVVGAKLLHAYGFGPGSLVEVQKWLKEYGHSLRIQAPSTSTELIDVEQAITVLEIYGIEVVRRER